MHQILRCDKPFENVKYTFYISKFSPVPDAIEFIPGNDYYFICKSFKIGVEFLVPQLKFFILKLKLLATSNGTLNGLNNTEGGACKANNMKIVIRVLGKIFIFSNKP